MTDLNKLDRLVAGVKREIMRNRKMREEALQQAQSFSKSLAPQSQPKPPKPSKQTDKAS